MLDCAGLPDPLAYEAEFSKESARETLTVPNLLERLPKERIEKIRRLKHPDARKQSFGAGLLLDYAMSAKDRADGRNQFPAFHGIFYNRYGKPLAKKAAFNLSHSGRYAIVSIRQNRSGQLPVGCDIEQISSFFLSESDKSEKIAARFFKKEEYESLNSLADAYEKALQSCRYWTRKESVLKLTGLGMSLPMDTFDVRDGRTAVPDAGRLRAWMERDKNKTQPQIRQAVRLLLGKQLFFKEYRYDNCCICVCSLENQFQPELFVADRFIYSFFEYAKK